MVTFFIQESGESHLTVDSDGQHTLLPQSDGEKQHGGHVFPGAAREQVAAYHLGT